MRIQIIFCHPSRSSFARAACEAVHETLKSERHVVDITDLYQDGFNPVVSEGEYRLYKVPRDTREPLIEGYVEKLRSADAVVFIYPSWWYGMPAMLKGYLERVWAPGIAFDINADDKIESSRLSGISRIGVVTTHGGSWWLNRVVLGGAARKIVTRGMRRLCAPDCHVDWVDQFNMDHATQGLRPTWTALRV